MGFSCARRACAVVCRGLQGQTLETGEGNRAGRRRETLHRRCGAVRPRGPRSCGFAVLQSEQPVRARPAAPYALRGAAHVSGLTSWHRGIVCLYRRRVGSQRRTCRLAKARWAWRSGYRNRTGMSTNVEKDCEEGLAWWRRARPAISQGVATIQRQGRTPYALCLLTSDVR